MNALDLTLVVGAVSAAVLGARVGWRYVCGVADRARQSRLRLDRRTVQRVTDTTRGSDRGWTRARP